MNPREGPSDKTGRQYWLTPLRPDQQLPEALKVKGHLVPDSSSSDEESVDFSLDDFQIVGKETLFQVLQDYENKDQIVRTRPREENDSAVEKTRDRPPGSSLYHVKLSQSDLELLEKGAGPPPKPLSKSSEYRLKAQHLLKLADRLLTKGQASEEEEPRPSKGGHRVHGHSTKRPSLHSPDEAGRAHGPAPSRTTEDGSARLENLEDKNNDSNEGPSFRGSPRGTRHKVGSPGPPLSSGSQSDPPPRVVSLVPMPRQLPLTYFTPPMSFSASQDLREEDDQEKEKQEKEEEDDHDDPLMFPDQASKKFSGDVLRAHNDYRQKHGCPPIKLDNKLNRDAQQYAEALAITKVLKHSSESSRGNCGENLAWASYDQPGQDVADRWYSEIRNYDFKSPGFSPESGHFTAMIWKSTKKMGIGKASANDGSSYVVARYFPAGNIVNPGFFEENVPRPEKK